MGRQGNGNLKIILVGEPGSGKSSLLHVFRNGRMPTPTDLANECQSVTARIPLEIQPVPANDSGASDQPEWAIWRNPLKWMMGGAGTSPFGGGNATIVGDDGGGGVILEVSMEIWDSKGGDEFARLRPLRYPGTHVVGICVPIDDKSSMDTILNKVGSSFPC